MRRTEKAAMWLLYAQLALTVAALVLAGMSMTSSRTTTASGMTMVSGAVVSAPIIICGVLLIVAGIVGLVALRRPSLYLRAGIILLAPLVLAVASSVPSEDEVGVQVQDMWQPLQQTLRLLEWSAWLVFGAVVIAALVGVLLLTAGRRSRTM